MALSRSFSSLVIQNIFMKLHKRAIHGGRGGASAPQLLQILDHGNVESARVAGEVRRRRAARDGEERVEANARNGARRSRCWPDAALDEANVRALGRAGRKTAPWWSLARIPERAVEDAAGAAFAYLPSSERPATRRWVGGVDVRRQVPWRKIHVGCEEVRRQAPEKAIHAAGARAAFGDRSAGSLVVEEGNDALVEVGGRAATARHEADECSELEDVDMIGDDIVRGTNAPRPLGELCGEPSVGGRRWYIRCVGKCCTVD